VFVIVADPIGSGFVGPVSPYCCLGAATGRGMGIHSAQSRKNKVKKAKV
jgi:hypothetical protein